jgi:hypothetical protein
VQYTPMSIYYLVFFDSFSKIVLRVLNTILQVILAFILMLE